MVKLFRVIFFLLSLSVYSQKIDYNLQNGLMADGYDLVAYFKDKPSMGKKAYSTKYNNIKFNFSSEENLIMFLKSPKKYIPQYGGYCAYAIAEKKTKMDIDAETYEIRDGKLYLFYNSWFSSKLEDWQEGDTEQLQLQGDENWKLLQYKK